MLPWLLACTASPLVPGEVDTGSVDTGSSNVLPGDSAADTGEPPDDADGVFATDRVGAIELTMARADWADIRDNPGAESWHEAEFSWNGEAPLVVAVRAFGQGSVVAGKPPLKVDFNRSVPGQDWHGLETLKLDSSTQDAGFLNEVVGTWVLREMGLPAARTGFATVHVNGDAVGLFVALEPIDDRFLKRNYDVDDGSLYGIGTWRYGQGLNPIEWGTVADWYEPQTSAGGDGAEILAAIEATGHGSDAEFLAAVDTVAFTRMSLTRAAIGAIDSFAADGNNFYLYDHGGQITPIAWDLDADLGYPYYFDNALFMGLEEPWLWSHARQNPMTGTVYHDPVHARVLAMGWDVQATLDELLAGPLSWPSLEPRLTAWAATIAEAGCADTYHSCASFQHRVIDLRFFLHTRLAILAGGEVAECPAAPSFGATAQSGTLLENTSTLAPGLMVGGEHHCHGLYASVDSRVTLPVSEGLLDGAVGIHDANLNPSAGARVAILQGGRTLWESGAIDAYAPAERFSVTVEAGEVELRSTGRGGGGAVVWTELAN